MAKSRPAQSESDTPRDRIIDALMALAGDMHWSDITLPMIAARADVNLADLRDHYPSKGAILGGFAKRIDRVVLAPSSADMLGEPARERLLDVMMRRLDALAPYKSALREIRRATRRDPLTLAAFNQLALNSWRYMLAAADLDTEDELGMVRVQGAALMFVRTLDVWFEDDGEDMARTMAFLDKELTRGEKIMGRLEDMRRMAAPFRGFMRAAMDRRGKRREERA
jgi:AcrR family transcriptional regulator